ncbi:hypothetical protein FIBSPDRAFT_936380 [Athelia psychrophila]|uniref:BTB domain-containing protein n=1 Tax=Athelia psychrophila TaxID=1759441 RepID=A0A166C9P6_9AGAM|nr:hypothetical protein FIBSPDRAFT_936380 [Fibularhizoctonia sp. CBS 109695]
MDAALNKSNADGKKGTWAVLWAALRQHATDTACQALIRQIAPTKGDLLLRLLVTKIVQCWLDDGNIVIQAEKTQFKVHRSLAAHSPIFKDVFLMPQPPKHVATRKALSITIIAAFLREYPSTVEEYDKIKAWSMAAGSKVGGIHFAVVNLAREQGILSVLPLSLGVPSGDGTTTMILPDNLIASLGAWNSIGLKQSTTTLAWINSPTSTYPTCANSTQCTKFRVEVRRNIFYPFVVFVGLYTWREFQAGWVYSEEDLAMCDAYYAVVLGNTAGHLRFA